MIKGRMCLCGSLKFLISNPMKCRSLIGTVAFFEDVNKPKCTRFVILNLVTNKISCASVSFMLDFAELACLIAKHAMQVALLIHTFRIVNVKTSCNPFAI